MNPEHTAAYGVFRIACMHNSLDGLHCTGLRFMPDGRLVALWGRT